MQWLLLYAFYSYCFFSTSCNKKVNHNQTADISFFIFLIKFCQKTLSFKWQRFFKFIENMKYKKENVYQIE